MLSSQSHFLDSLPTKWDRSQSSWLCNVYLYLGMCNRCSSSSNEALGVKKTVKYDQLQAAMNTLISSFKCQRCLFVVLIFYFILHFSGDLVCFTSKGFLHQIFLVLREVIPLKLSVRNWQSIHVCVCACLCVLKILTSRYIMSWEHNSCHIDMCFKWQNLSM